MIGETIKLAGAVLGTGKILTDTLLSATTCGVNLLNETVEDTKNELKSVVHSTNNTDSLGSPELDALHKLERNIRRKPSNIKTNETKYLGIQVDREFDKEDITLIKQAVSKYFKPEDSIKLVTMWTEFLEYNVALAGALGLDITVVTNSLNTMLLSEVIFITEHTSSTEHLIQKRKDIGKQDLVFWEE